MWGYGKIGSYWLLVFGLTTKVTKSTKNDTSFSFRLFDERRTWKDGGNMKHSGGIYGLGFIGASIYFIEHAHGFWMGVFGILKALVWPAIAVYKALDFFLYYK